MGVYSVFMGLLTQLCSSSLNVCGMWTHVCIHKAHFLSLPSLAHSIFTALWCGSVIKLNTFYLHQAPSWLCLVQTNSPVTQGILQRPVGTTVQIIPGLHRIRSIMDMREVREHPDSTISKVLTVIKWRIITTLNKKLLEQQRYRTALLLLRYTQVTFFHNFNATVSFGNPLKPVYIQILNFFTELTN